MGGMVGDGTLQRVFADSLTTDTGVLPAWQCGLESPNPSTGRRPKTTVNASFPSFQVSE